MKIEKRFRIIILVIFIMYFNVKAISQSLIQKQDTMKYDGNAKEQIEVLKEYAFCSCIYQGYKIDSINLRDFSNSLLLEMYRYNFNALSEMSDYAKSFVDSLLPSKYFEYDSTRFISINCLKFYKSKLLEEYIKSIIIKYKIPYVKSI